MFDIGQKLICVDATFPRGFSNYLRNLPKLGQVYTVRDIIAAQDWQTAPGKPGADTCAVLLAEVINPPPPHRKQWGECGFAPRRFAEVSPEQLEALAWAENEGIL